MSNFFSRRELAEALLSAVVSLVVVKKPDALEKFLLILNNDPTIIAIVNSYKDMGKDAMGLAMKEWVEKNIDIIAKSSPQSK